MWDNSGWWSMTKQKVKWKTTKSFPKHVCTSLQRRCCSSTKIHKLKVNPIYCVKSHLSTCWNGKNASGLIDLVAALPSGSPLHHPNHPLSTISTEAWDPNWICPKKMTQIIPSIAPTICYHTWRWLQGFVTPKWLTELGGKLFDSNVQINIRFAESRGAEKSDLMFWKQSGISSSS